MIQLYSNWINVSLKIQHQNKTNVRIVSGRKRANEMFCLMSDDMELYKQFTDNPTLKKWLSNMVFRMIYNSSEKLLQSRAAP